MSREKLGIIFDMDGTLWDSAENVAVSWNLAIREADLGQRTLTEADIRSVMGRTMDQIADCLFCELSPGQRRSLMDACCERENAYLREHGGILYEGVEETFQRLRERGFSLYIVSNCQKGYIEAFLDYYRLWGYMEDIECYGSHLCPKGENIRLVADRNHLDRAVYVGDIQGDYDASRQAGVGFIHAAYGFGTIDAAVTAIHDITELSTMEDIMGEMK